MAEYSELQEREFALKNRGLKTVKHQGLVGRSSITKMKDSIEATQF
jgi:isocitrate lyase